MLASIIKKEKKKASRFYPTYLPYLLTFLFLLTPPGFLFSNLLWDRIMHVCIPKIPGTLLKVCAYL